MRRSDFITQSRNALRRALTIGSESRHGATDLRTFAERYVAPAIDELVTSVEKLAAVVYGHDEPLAGRYESVENQIVCEMPADVRLDETTWAQIVAAWQAGGRKILSAADVRRIIAADAA